MQVQYKDYVVGVDPDSWEKGRVVISAKVIYDYEKKKGIFPADKPFPDNLDEKIKQVTIV